MVILLDMIQTRSDNYTASKWCGINTFTTIAEAHAAWREDPSIYKISWFTLTNNDDAAAAEEHYRYVVKTRAEQWSPRSEEKLCALSPTYRATATDDSKTIFWVRQAVIPDWSDEELVRLRKTLPSSEYDALYWSSLIKEILTDEEFQRQYISPQSR